MRICVSLLLALIVAGCATQKRAARVSPVLAVEPAPRITEQPGTRLVETRYDVRAYRDPVDLRVRHDAHAVYRATRVPERVGALETVPRGEFAPVSYAPLPTDAELTAELSTQKQITEQLRAIQSKMSAIEQQARDQFGTLVSQTEESVKLRVQVGADRARVQELEAMLRDHPAPATERSSPAVATTAVTEMKW
jgi:hypothetical protein